MTHNRIYEVVKEKFTEEENDKRICLVNKKAIKEWFPNGKNSIRIIFCDGSVLVFSIFGSDWRIETLNCFIEKTMKEG